MIMGEMVNPESPELARKNKKKDANSFVSFGVEVFVTLIQQYYKPARPKKTGSLDGNKPLKFNSNKLTGTSFYRATLGRGAKKG